MVPTRSKPRQAGFTMLELVVVVAVLALLSMAAIPSSSVSKKRKLDLLQLQIQDAIDHAKSMAYHTGAEYGVILNSNHQFIAVTNEMATPMEDPLKRAAYVVRLNRPDQPSGIRVEDCDFGFRPVVPFNDKGDLDYPGQILISADGQERLLELNTATVRLREVSIGS